MQPETSRPEPSRFRTAAAAWCGLIVLTLIWDGWLAPLNTGRWLLLLKLVPLCLPIRGILSGRIYTYQYCSMLVLPYFAEGVMRLFDAAPPSPYFAAAEAVLAALFFIACLAYLKSLKIKKETS